MQKIILLLKMAARNIVKYGRRSVQSAAAVFLGVFFVGLAGAFMSGFASGITRELITEGGHVVITAPGYAERREMMPLNRLIPGVEAARRELANAAPGVNAFASLYAPGLVSRGGKPEDTLEGESTTVLCAGIMPFAAGIANPAVSSVRDRVKAGRFFGPAGDRGIVLSDKTATTIGAVPGNTVIFLCSDAFGSFSMIELPLLGVFSADAFAGEFSCLMDLESLQSATGAADEAAQITAYAIDGAGALLEPRKAAAPVRAIEAKAIGMGLAAERWDAASGSVTAMINFVGVFMVISYVLFGVVAVVGIMNSILLSVQDRVRDFGTLRAIAFSGNGVSAIIIVEALLLGAGASLLGTLAAWGVSGYFQVHCIDLSYMSEVTAAYPAEIRTVTDPLQFLLSFVAGALIPVIASLYPVGMIRKMSIREALGFV